MNKAKKNQEPSWKKIVEIPIIKEVLVGYG